MSSHPDADAFTRAILSDPAEVTTRLAFADWLEETGEPANAAWAEFIRLREEADRLLPAGRRRREVGRRLAELELRVRATLTVAVAEVLGRAEHFWRLLPKPNLIVRLGDHTVPQPVVELVPESVARENLVLPLDLRWNCLTVATANPTDFDTIQKLEFILNKDVVALRAEAGEILAAIDRHYGLTETESIDSILVEFADVGVPVTDRRAGPAPDDTDAPVVHLLNLIFTVAIHAGATDIRLFPTTEGVVAQYRVRGTWLRHEPAPARLWPAIARRIAILASIPIGDVVERRPWIAGVIPIRHRNTDYLLRVSADEQVEGVFVEIERPDAPA